MPRFGVPIDSMMRADLGTYDDVGEGDGRFRRDGSGSSSVDEESKHSNALPGLTADSLVKELAPYLHDLTDEFGPDMPEFESLEEDSDSFGLVQG